MADLKVGAPLVHEEYEEDWNDFSETTTSDNGSVEHKDSDNHSSVQDTVTKNSHGKMTNSCNSDDSASSFMDSFMEKGNSGSLEDLVNTFDKQLSECFGDYKSNVSIIAPVQVRSQEEIINGCQTWLTLTGSYGNALPIDWSKCYTKELQTKSLHLLDSPRQETAENLDLSDDEELKEALDVHAIISPMVPHSAEEDINADDVIQEIDTIMKMQDSMNTDDTGYITEPDMLTSAESDSLHFKDMQPSIERVNLSEEVQQLSVRQLNDMVEELKTEINVQSEILASQYASGDEMSIEKELKNTFISLCHEVKKKQKPHGSKDKRRSNITETATSASGTKYVIPYQLTQMPPSNDLLRVYIRILKAIHDDQPNVPAMLTEYILKVVCPTS
ncbi:fasciculation and elongation protein zeta-2-like isoform X2 [Watersipora subatra]|uniref:fasciculation and elongation protein zeta-2-like isoform X2 n=1 Tax=Watersipora subatra TaxID=2589382 RepID=UPI00355C13AF